MISNEEFDSTIAAMKRHGVIHFRNGDLEITLHPAALAEDAVKPPEADPKMLERGITGETRQDQIDKYGVVHEADFRKK